MRTIRLIGYVQIRIFGFIAWIISVFLLFKLWGAIGILVGFSPLVIIGPIYHIFTNGLDSLSVYFLLSTALSILGFVILALANNSIEQPEEGSFE